MKRSWPSLLVGTGIAIVAIIPAVAMAWLLWRNCVNILYWDEWMNDLSGLLPALHAGHLSVAQLFAAHNESRLPILRVLFLAACWFHGGDPRWLNWCSWLLAGFTLYNLWIVARLALPTIPLAGRAVLIGLTSLLLFSPVQTDGWLWSMIACFFLANAMFVWAMRVAWGNQREWMRWGLCAVLCLLATFSYVNGFLSWLLIPILLVARCDKRRLWPLIAWFGLAGIMGWLYFAGWKWTPSSAHAMQSADFLLVVLGSALACFSANAAHTSAVAGGILLVFFALLAVSLLRRQHAVVWIVLGLYALLTALLITAGRAGGGIDNALSSRYRTLMLYFPVAVLHLLAIWIAGLPSPLRRLVIRGTALAATAFTMLLLFNWQAGAAQMSETRNSRLASKGVLDWIDVLPQYRAALNNLWPDPNLVMARAHQLNAMQLYDPPLLQSAAMDRIDGVAGKLRNGQLESLRHLRDGNIYASGWAFLPLRGRPADLVVLSYRDAAGRDIAFAYEATGGMRDNMAKQLGPDALTSGWAIIAADPNITPSTMISAWAFDADAGKAYRLPRPE